MINHVSGGKAIKKSPESFYVHIFIRHVPRIVSRTPYFTPFFIVILFSCGKCYFIVICFGVKFSFQVFSAGSRRYLIAASHMMEHLLTTAVAVLFTIRYTTLRPRSALISAMPHRTFKPRCSPTTGDKAQLLSRTIRELLSNTRLIKLLIKIQIFDCLRDNSYLGICSCFCLLFHLEKLSESNYN